ncbi:MAG: LamG-like jellyroll fold domain-containing protein [Planctomycetota bacterium]
MNEADNKLIDTYLDGNLASDQAAAFQELLRNDPEARACLRRRAAIDERLTDLAASAVAIDRRTSDSTLTVRVESAVEPKVIPDQTARGSYTPLQIILPWAIAATLAVILFVGREATEKDPQTQVKAEPFIGLLVDEAGAEFEPGFGPQDVKFNRGEYRLQKGAIHLRLENGTDVVMGSPVAFEIHDAFRLTLDEGILSAYVPPSAKGFTVAAPGIDYEDLGTEFAVAVNPASGASELHVFDGQVDAKIADSRSTVSSVYGGESVAFAEGALQPADAPDERRFLTRGAIGFLRWQQETKRRITDPGLIAFYSFSGSGQVLKNEASNAVVSDGKIEGARWVSGRWPEKSALLFDRESDFVEIDIPGKYEEMSFAAWVKLDRLDHSLNSILNSNGKDPGDLHWEIAPDGAVILVRRFDEPRVSREDLLTIPLGRWIHIAGTISTVDGESRVYLNGELASSELGPLTSFVPGLSRIGNWLNDKNEHKRWLCGRIDEFAIWNLKLTPTEIKHFAEAGKPNSLWSVTPGSAAASGRLRSENTWSDEP